MNKKWLSMLMTGALIITPALSFAAAVEDEGTILTEQEQGNTVILNSENIVEDTAISDENNEVQKNNNDTVQDADYKLIDGNEQTYNGSGDISFTVSGLKEDLIEIAIAPVVSENGKVTILNSGEDYITNNVDSSGYFTLKESYLNTLEKGEYHIYFTYKDGNAAGTFTVAMPEYKVVYGDKSVYDKDSDGLIIGIQEQGVSANRIRVIPVGCSNIDDTSLVEGKDYQRIAVGFDDAKEGATYYHIFDDYLKTLKNAEYVISFEYGNGNAYATFDVKANPDSDCSCNCTCHCNCELQVSPKTMDIGAAEIIRHTAMLMK